MDNRQLLDAVGAALRQAGYTQVAVHDGADGSFVTATKDRGGAYFRITDDTKSRSATRRTCGGPEPASGIQPGVTPTIPGLQEYLRQHPQAAPAFGISEEALRHLK